MGVFYVRHAKQNAAYNMARSATTALKHTYRIEERRRVTIHVTRPHDAHTTPTTRAHDAHDAPTTTFGMRAPRCTLHLPSLTFATPACTSLLCA